ncbi:uncharacterized protein LOC128307520 [Anopheles moucheti]|uniref:uncharacterized protein LOC128307520 n=1 Tax=Anopheles moucheti TaxID=186751 RepID=UPI0022F07E44|nr:uncharacterized protein LOC128307520 [Anopheles moucheti]
MSTSRILRPRSGLTDTRPPMVVGRKLTTGQASATNVAASATNAGAVAAATGTPMERLRERLEEQLALLRTQLAEQADQYRKDLVTMQENHRLEVLHLREENRKEREMVAGLLAQLASTQQTQQQQQQLPQQRAGAHQQQQWQLKGQLLSRQNQQQPRTAVMAKKSRKRPDTIEVIPADGISYLEMYKAIRTSSHLDGMQEKIGVGKRTPKDTLRLPLSRDVDSAELCQRIRQAIGDKGAASVRTEMAEVLVTNIDSLANEDQLRKAVLTALGKEHSEATIEMWERRDGTMRARVRLPRTDADHLAGKRLLLGYTSCWVWEVPKTPLAEKRCFRCLERGHFDGQCSGDDRSKVCIRCGAEGHKAVTCIGKVRCLKCGGPHPIASALCNAAASR